ncbi:hypothetical protein VNO77_30319 [Canavalia gladiata]|uniref:Uncharacterized protein n=1 Tax=Canavalia gladiata TaxID=3824 RepID=A0AAN9KNB5_CANGL
MIISLNDLMKRNSVNSRQPYGPLEDAKLTFRYYSRLEDYLELQKEYVSKKKKLRVEKQKREILLNEVRFLRHRRRYLTKSQLAKVESELGPLQSEDINYVSIEKERNCIANETSIQQESNGKEELEGKTLSIEKPMNFSTNEKESRKKKVSWNDKVAVIMV